MEDYAFVEEVFRVKKRIGIFGMCVLLFDLRDGSRKVKR